MMYRILHINYSLPFLNVSLAATNMIAVSKRSAKQFKRRRLTISLLHYLTPLSPSRNVCCADSYVVTKSTVERSVLENIAG